MSEFDVTDFLILLKDNPEAIKGVKTPAFLKALVDRDSKLLDIITDEQVDILNKFIDPYTSLGVPENKDQHLLFSYTNLKTETINRMAMLGTVAFLFQAVREYGLKPTDFTIKPMPEMEEKRKVINEFLVDLFKYDPSKHIQACYQTYVNQEVNNPKKLYFIPDTVSEELKPLIENPLSEDLFSGYDRFYTQYYNEIYGLTHQIWGLSSQIDCKINPYFCGTKAQCDEFQEKYGGDMRLKVDSISMGYFTLLGPWRQNLKNTVFAVEKGKDEQIDINKAMKVPDYTKIRNEMTRKKIADTKKERNITPEEEETIRKYQSLQGINDLVNNLDNEEPDLGETQYNVIIHDAATGEVKIKAINALEDLHTNS